MNSKRPEPYSLGMDSSKPIEMTENENKNELFQFENPETLYYGMDSSKLKNLLREVKIY